MRVAAWEKHYCLKGWYSIEKKRKKRKKRLGYFLGYLKRDSVTMKRIVAKKKNGPLAG